MRIVNLVSPANVNLATMDLATANLAIASPAIVNISPIAKVQIVNIAYHNVQARYIVNVSL